jgi:hypothetical protein
VKELTQIPFHDTTIYTTADGAYVALRPVCEALDLDYASQFKRVQNQPWATVVIMTTVAADSKMREMTFIDRRTFTMWLATIDTGRLKNEHTRELVRTYQCEAADALDKYFNEGAAINPRAMQSPDTEDPALVRAAGLADIIGRFRGIIDDGYLEAKARIVLARAMGDTPEIEASARPLYVQDYMRERGVSSDDIKSYAPTFGKYVKKAYKAERGVEPGKRFDETPSGQVREVCVYTEADRPILDRAWRGSYANGFPPKKEVKKNKEEK